MESFFKRLLSKQMARSLVFPYRPTIEEKLKSGVYKSVYDFYLDVGYMLTTVENKSNPLVASITDDMLEWVKKRICVVSDPKLFRLNQLLKKVEKVKECLRNESNEQEPQPQRKIKPVENPELLQERIKANKDPEKQIKVLALLRKYLPPFTVAPIIEIAYKDIPEELAQEILAIL